MKVAYIASRYPAISHTFIMREVLALRAAGIDVHTFAIRRVKEKELLSDLDRSESASTKAILPAGLIRVFVAHGGLLVRSPARYFATLWDCLTRRPPGIRFALWYIFYFIEAGIFAAALRRDGIGHIHAHFANVAANVARLAAKLAGVSWSLTIHGQADFGDPTVSRLSDKIASAAFTVCVSDFGKAQAMLQTAPELWSKIHRIYCGIDTDRFQPTDTVTEAESPRALRLLTVARLSPEKGLTVLIDALRQVRDQGTAVSLTVVGDGPLRAALESQANRLGLRECVNFPGPVGQDGIRDYYARADAFVLPSFSEGLPVVLMEAMAMRLPVIATRITGIPELIREGVDGLLVAPGNVEELAESIRYLARDPALRARLAASAWDRVRDGFDARVTQAPLFALFRGLRKDLACSVIQPEPQALACATTQKE